jgi:hypothetical protein
MCAFGLVLMRKPLVLQDVFDIRLFGSVRVQHALENGVTLLRNEIVERLVGSAMVVILDKSRVRRVLTVLRHPPWKLLKLHAIEDDGASVTNKVVAKLGMIFGEVFFYISSSIT